MPCMTYPSDEEIRAEKALELEKETQRRIAEAGLCAIFKTFGMEFIHKIDLEGSGLSKSDLANWWAYHQKEDLEKRIPKSKLLELAIRCGFKPTGSALPQKYVDFALVMCEELEKVNYDSMALSMEFIAELAKKHGGWDDYQVGSDPNGLVDLQKMLLSQQEGVFFERFTHQIAAVFKA